MEAGTVQVISGNREERAKVLEPKFDAVREMLSIYRDGYLKDPELRGEGREGRPQRGSGSVSGGILTPPLSQLRRKS
jgi:hypothetical protein